jgi:hypothetical protein
MKKVIVLLVAVFGLTCVKAQPCLPEGITFTTQEEIDNFQTNYPGCTVIQGDVWIQGSTITNLDGLSALTSIWGDLTLLGNSALTNLAGLEGLTTIGVDLWINSNDALTNLTGLSGLTTLVGDFDIVGNDALTNLTGLEGLTSIWNISIASNGALTSLTGLEGLTSIADVIYIFNNYSLTNLAGLENLTNFEGYVNINNNNSLSACEVQWLCEYLSNPEGAINIYDNAIGCNSVIQLANACGGTMPCLPSGNYYFGSQSDIDNFQSAFPNCTTLEGNITISGSDISNLNGLNMVTSIAGDLVIRWNSTLVTLIGLEDLTFIGGGLSIWQNNALTSLTGLEGLTSIGGYLSIWQDYTLTSLTGLEGLASISGNLEISNNNALITLTGLEGLTTIGGDFFVGNNPLTNLTGLEGLTSIGGFLNIYNNDPLTSLSGLGELISIGGPLLISYTDALTTLTGLEGLTTIGGSLKIEWNDALTSLKGLDNIQTNSITNLNINNNLNLEECDVYSICQYLAAPNGPIQIYNNASGCNSEEEVEQHCLTTIEEIDTGKGITIIPNPSKDKITISSSAITGITQLSIFNVSGEKVMERKLTDNETQIDISALPRGVYFVKLQNEKMVEVGKMVKE